MPYFILSGAEIMVSITGLEFAYTQAPPSMKSTIMSFFYLTITIGNLFTGTISQMNVFGEGSPKFFFFFAGLQAVVSIFFIWGAMRYKVRNYVLKS